MTAIDTPLGYAEMVYDDVPALPARRAESRVLHGLAVAGLLLAATISALSGRLPHLLNPFDSDAAMFLYMGRIVADGQPFFHELIDNKFPSVGLVTSVAWRAFGDNWWMYVAAQLGMALLIVVMLTRTAVRHAGRHALIPTLAAGLVLVNVNTAVFGGFQLESIIALLGTLGACAAIEALVGEDWRDAFVVGLCAGVASMLKPTGLAIAGAFGLVVLLSQWRRPGLVLRMGLSTFAGLALPIGVMVTYYVQWGMLEQVLWLSGQIAAYAKHSVSEWIDWMKLPEVGLAITTPLLLRAWLQRKDKDEIQQRVPGRVWGLAVAWLAIETVGVAMQRRMYGYHFLVMLPAVALMFGLMRRPMRVGAVTIALAPLMIFSTFGGSLHLVHRDGGAQRQALAWYIMDRTEPGDRMWMDDAPATLLQTGLTCASRYPLTFLFANHDTAGLEISQAIVADLAERRPKYIVLHEDPEAHYLNQTSSIRELKHFEKRRASHIEGWKRIIAFVHGEYELEGRVAGFGVWRRQQPDIERP